MNPIVADSWLPCGTTAATDWAKMMAGVYLAGCPAMVWRRIGANRVTPAKVAIAPAVWRMISPSPSPRSANRLRNAPVRTTARSTPGCPRCAVGATPVDRMAWPKKKATKLMISPTTRVTRPTTVALAANRVSHRGTAARDERMVPDPYSPEMARTPRTPSASDPMASPAMAWFVGSQPENWYHWRGWCAAPLVERKVTSMVPRTVMPSSNFVERREASLLTSAATAWRKPTRPSRAAGVVAGNDRAMVTRSPFGVGGRSTGRYELTLA